MSQLARRRTKFSASRNRTVCVKVTARTNSQITKARINYENNLYISYNFFNSFINFFWLCWLTLFFENKILWLYQTEKWKMYTVSKLVGISEAIRSILTNSVLYTAIFFHRGGASSFHVNSESYPEVSVENPSIYDDTSFNQWLAGLIDGDGYFNLSKKGIARLFIVMDIRDKKALYDIKHKFGGSINKIANANALRYNLSNKKGLVHLINAVNGSIRNPTRMLQINKLCEKYNIIFKYPEPLSFNNGWLSGFIDSDGSVYFNEKSGQVFISVTQKNLYLLQPLIAIYGGRVDPVGKKIEAFKYVIYRKNELFNLIDNYFNKYPLKSMKHNRINLIKSFYILRVYYNSKNRDDLQKLNQWVNFKDKWEKCQS